jgi:hypothetical protein
MTQHGQLARVSFCLYATAKARKADHGMSLTFLMPLIAAAMGSSASFSFKDIGKLTGATRQLFLHAVAKFTEDYFHDIHGEG